MRYNLQLITLEIAEVFKIF